MSDKIAVMRLTKEAQQLAENAPSFISARPNADELFNWKATVKGPNGTPYERGTFHLELRFTTKYPMKPPEVRLVTKVYHCNIGIRGEICLDILRTQWRPVMGIENILLSFISLLSEPNPAEPLMPSAARLYNADKAKYNDVARKWTNWYARTNIQN